MQWMILEAVPLAYGAKRDRREELGDLSGDK